MRTNHHHSHGKPVHKQAKHISIVFSSDDEDQSHEVFENHEEKSILSPEKMNENNETKNMETIENENVRDGEVVDMLKKPQIKSEDDYIKYKSYVDTIYSYVLSNKNLYEISKPRKVDASFQLTRMSMPLNNRIEYHMSSCSTLADKHLDCSQGLYFVKSISEEAFFQFQFGMMCNEPNPDRLHIFVWHNIGIPAEKIAQSIFSILTHMGNSFFKFQYFRSVISYVFGWIHFFPKDFVENEKCTKTLVSTLDFIESEYNELKDDTVLLKCLIRALTEHAKTLSDFLFIIPTPKITKLHDNDMTKLYALKIDPKILSMHFMYNGLVDWHKITIEEITQARWADPVKKKNGSPNVLRVISHANNRMHFIVTTVMNFEPKKRHEVVEYWLKVLKESCSIRNYQLVFMIDGALSNPVIIEQTKMLKKVDNNMMRLYQVAREITTPSRKCMRKFEEEVSKEPKKTLPFIGPFLSEMVAINEGNETYIKTSNGEKWINMAKQRAYMAEVDLVYKQWGGDIKFEIDPDLQILLTEIDGCKDKMTI